MTELLQYVIVPYELNMSAGKMSSQVAHATFMALEKQRQWIKEDNAISDDGKWSPVNPCWHNIDQWKQSGMCVVVLGCESVSQLFGLKAYCEQWGIPHHMYVDEGITETLPMLPTAFATGVVDKETIGQFFQKFELYTDHRKEQEGRWLEIEKLI